MNNITANKIQALLARKHSDDIFVSECKDGPTIATNHLRMDAWTMKRSWTNPLSIAYEIKVSRQDFLNDHKWHNYLNYCNEFYFVCPSGLIDKSELPDEVGLIYIAKTGTRLFKKKPAQRRIVELPVSLLKYILICRAEIRHERYIDSREQNISYWLNWLEEKRESKNLGYNVSRRIANHVESVDRENERLKSKMEDYDEFMSRLHELGFDISKPVNSWNIRNKLNELTGQVPDNLEYSLERTIKGLSELLKLIQVVEVSSDEK
jgi:hypothetical protein